MFFGNNYDTNNYYENKLSEYINQNIVIFLILYNVLFVSMLIFLAYKNVTDRHNIENNIENKNDWYDYPDEYNSEY